MIKCVIFDCDGTLVDSELLCSEALEYEFAKYGVEYPAQKMLSIYRGVKMSEILASVSDQNGVTLEEDFEKNYRDLIAKRFQSDLKTCQGAEDMLANISLPMCVASSGPLKKITLSLTVTGLLPFFGRHLYSCYDIGKWKPEPDIFIHAAKQMGYLPQECLVIEDSSVGIAAAKAASMRSVHYMPHEPSLASSAADFKITHLSQLPSLIADLFHRADK